MSKLSKDQISNILNLTNKMIDTGFDPVEEYPGYDGMKPIGHAYHQVKVGEAANLLVDLTTGGATEDEIARVCRYSAVLLQAEKYNLDWYRCRKEMDIDGLREKYKAPYYSYYVCVDVLTSAEAFGEPLEESYSRSSSLIHKTKDGAIKEADELIRHMIDGEKELNRGYEELEADPENHVYKAIKFSDNDFEELALVYVMPLKVED